MGYNIIKIMPIYEYICETCHHKFEVLIRGKERPACPKCHGHKLNKLFSTFAALSSKEAPACASRTPYCPQGPCSGGGTCPAGMGK